METLEKVILVDDHDREIGTGEKHEVHRQGSLHRAFSVIIWDSAERILLQQRSGMETIGADADAGMVQIAAAEMTAGPTSDHIRVDLDQHRAVRVIPQRRLQHPPETGGPRQPQGD